MFFYDFESLIENLFQIKTKTIDRGEEYCILKLNFATFGIKFQFFYLRTHNQN